MLNFQIRFINTYFLLCIPSFATVSAQDDVRCLPVCAQFSWDRKSCVLVFKSILSIRGSALRRHCDGSCYEWLAHQSFCLKSLKCIWKYNAVTALTGNSEFVRDQKLNCILRACAIFLYKLIIQRKKCTSFARGQHQLPPPSLRVISS